MNLFQNKKTWVLISLLAVSQMAFATDVGCWADFFEQAQYAGKHLHIIGPATLENLDQVSGEDWNRRIHSIKVGSQAKVTVFQNPRFEMPLNKMAKNTDFMRSLGITELDIKEDAELIFNENAAIHTLGDFGFNNKIRSLKVDCI
jgi:hypothetical protein